MSDDALGERRRALEEAFFAQHNETLRQRLRQADETRSRKAQLSAASGITDDAVLEELVALKLDADTLAAMSLVPLVLVAWADGSLEASERQAIMNAAHEDGLDAQPAVRQMLEQWLGQRPSPALQTAWTDYMSAVARALAPERRQALKVQILGRARRVAEAAGGFMGLGSRISTFEAGVMQKLEQAFGH